VADPDGATSPSKEAGTDKFGYFAARFADPAVDQAAAIATACAVAAVHEPAELALLRSHPLLEATLLAHLTLRLTQPRRVWLSGEVGYLTPDGTSKRSRFWDRPAGWSRSPWPCPELARKRHRFGRGRRWRRGNRPAPPTVTRRSRGQNTGPAVGSTVTSRRPLECRIGDRHGAHQLGSGDRPPAVRRSGGTPPRVFTGVVPRA
jgi:hypothetical protein